VYLKIPSEHDNKRVVQTQNKKYENQTSEEKNIYICSAFSFLKKNFFNTVHCKIIILNEKERNIFGLAREHHKPTNDRIRKKP
jgi:hypothetical protein